MVGLGNGEKVNNKIGKTDRRLKQADFNFNFLQRDSYSLLNKRNLVGIFNNFFMQQPRNINPTINQIKFHKVQLKTKSFVFYVLKPIYYEKA